MIAAHNSSEDRDSDRISLCAYSLDQLEQAISEMWGEAPPSTGAQGAQRAAQTASAGGKAIKRKLQVSLRGSIAPRSAAHRYRAPAYGLSLTTTAASAPNTSARTTRIRSSIAELLSSSG